MISRGLFILTALSASMAPVSSVLLVWYARIVVFIQTYDRDLKDIEQIDLVWASHAGTSLSCLNISSSPPLIWRRQGHGGGGEPCNSSVASKSQIDIVGPEPNMHSCIVWHIVCQRGKVTLAKLWIPKMLSK